MGFTAQGGSVKRRLGRKLVEGNEREREKVREEVGKERGKKGEGKGEARKVGRKIPVTPRLICSSTHLYIFHIYFYPVYSCIHARACMGVRDSPRFCVCVSRFVEKQRSQR